MLSLGIAGAAAQVPESGRGRLEPRICVGFNPDSNEFAPLRRGAVLEIVSCPNGYGIMGVPQKARDPLPPESISVWGADCCPLPAGLLTDQHQFRPTVCPQGTIVTGYVLVPPDPQKEKYPTELLRCTHLDSRFTLSVGREADSYGQVPSGFPALLLGIPEFTRSRSSLPAALRYGLTRMSEVWWDMGGCVGSPPGALLVGKLGVGCSGLRFAQVVFRGLDGDPPAGTELPTLPNCQAIDNPFVTEPKCIAEQTQ